MKVLNYLFLLILLSVINSKADAQKFNKEYYEYFILGSLNDYMGRTGDPRLKDQFDFYFSSETAFTNLMDTTLSRAYSSNIYKVVRERIERSSRVSYQVYSDSLATHFNRFYNFFPTTSKTTEFEVIYYGKLKSGIFKNKKQELAFIAGCYARYGLPCDTAFYISLANSTSKASVCDSLLKKLNCTSSAKIIIGVPTSHKIYFHPTKEVLNALKPYMYLLGKNIPLTAPNKKRHPFSRMPQD